jgi:hypothetical protein
MKKRFSFIKFILFISALGFCELSTATDLESFCQEKGGEMKERFKCPNTSFPLLTPICHFGEREELVHFTDGCTGPTGGHRELFLKSCIAHDLCYHHEPSTGGKTQKDCDIEFRDGLLRACSDAENYEHCEKWAKTMYKALRVFGSLAYRCDNRPVDRY